MTEIKTSVTTLEDERVQLDVEVPKEEVAHQIDHTIKHLAGKVKIDGFRKGKVPKAMLVSRLGKETILSETLSEALPHWYDEAVAVAGIRPIDRPELDFEDLSGDDAFTFKATVAVRPRPKLGKYTGIEVEKEVVEVGDDEVDEPIERMRKRLAGMEVIEGRAAQEGDFVVIDFTGFVDGELLAGGTGRDFMLELGGGSFIPGFEEQVAGMEPGQSKKLTLTFPENYRPEELAGKEAEFEVALKEIKQRVLPELNDEFATEASEFDTLAELRDDIRGRMTKAREEAAQGLYREQALKQVAAESEVTVPEVMINNRAGSLKDEFLMALEDGGQTLEGYMEATGTGEEEMMKSFREQAERMVRQELVLDTIAEIEGIEVSGEEVEAEIRQQAVAMGYRPDQLVEEMRKHRRESVVRDRLLRRQALMVLGDKAVPVPGKAETAEAAAEEAGEEPEKP